MKMTTKKAFKKINVTCLRHIHELQTEVEKVKKQSKETAEALEAECKKFSLALHTISEFIKKHNTEEE
jgi:hypothetical protein